MTITARYNLQRGVPENKRNEWTDYSSDNSPLDNFIIQTMELREKCRIQKEIAEFDKELERHIEEVIDDLLKDLNK